MFPKWLWLVWLLFGLLPLLFGCPAPTPQPSQPEQATSSPKPTKWKQIREQWDIYYLQGKRVGHGRTTVSQSLDTNQELIRTEHFSRLMLRRGHDLSIQKFRISSLETSAGRLLSFESLTQMGPDSAICVRGEVQGNRLNITLQGTASKTPTTRSLEWSPDCGGPFALEQTLRRRPLQPGEQRTLKYLEPALNEVVELALCARDREPTTLHEGAQELLRVAANLLFPGGRKLGSVYWCDSSGEILKSRSEPLGLEAYRATRAAVFAEPDTAELDLLPQMLVKLAEPFPQPHHTKFARYRVRLETGNPAQAFISDTTQAVKPLDEHAAEVTVWAVRPGAITGNPTASPEEPSADDLTPNNFIESNHPRITALAEKAAAAEADSWKIATALERFVHQYVVRKDFTQVFATAAEVAQSQAGDCTEHAVLLAALLRARRIPARVVVGLVYLEAAQAFGYHMWTEAFLAGRWIPLDSILAQEGLGAAHLKLGRSNLKSENIADLFLPVLQLLGGLKIELLEAR